MKKPSVRRWIARCFIAILIFSVLLSAAANLHEAYVSAMRYGEERAAICAINVKHLLQHQWDMDAMMVSTDNDQYLEARKVLRGVCENYQLDALYIYRVDTAPPARFYYLCVSGDAKKDALLQEDQPLRLIQTERLYDAELAVLSGAKEAQSGVMRGAFGNVIAWFAPYRDLNGELKAVISMVFSFDTIKEIILHDFLVDMIPFALSLALGLMVLLGLVQRRIVKPITAISGSMGRFAQDSRVRPEPLHITQPDEIGGIAEAYEKMTGEISDYVNNIEALTKERVETNVQLELARRIQYGLVPEKTALDGAGFRVCAMTHPAKAVGGDFYECFKRDDGSVCVVMGDVSGKGITAAIFMAMIKTSIREKLMAGLGPADTLNQTNDELCAQNPESLFTTAFAAVFKPASGELLYANAGHTYPVLLKEKAELLIPDSGIALGMFENAGLTDHTLMLPYGQGILLYTDGVTEAVNPEKKFFGEKRLLEAVKDYRKDPENAEGVIFMVSRAVYDFCAGTEPFDDLAVLALIRLDPESGWQKIPVELSSFDTVKQAVFAAAGESPEARRALLACDEALANIVHYSGAAELSFRCEKKDELLCVAFSDNGAAFDPTKMETEEKDFDLLDSGGMGLSLIRQTVSSMCYERLQGRNVFTLFFRL